MNTYKIQNKYILSNSLYLIFPLLLTLISILDEGKVPLNEWMGLSIFWLIGIIVLFVPCTLKIKIVEDGIETYFLNFRTNKIYSSNVQSIEYGNLFHGGLGVGKGIKIWTKKNSGSLTYYSIGEKAYGEEALLEIKKVLSKS